MRTLTPRPAFLAVVAVAAMATGCRDCENLGAIRASGAIEPPLFEFGTLTDGQTCTAKLQVVNKGQEDLTVSKATLTNPVGNFTLQKSPTLVRLKAHEDLLVQYVVDKSKGKNQSTGIELTTDDPKNGGILRASITAIVTDAPAALVKTVCRDAGDSPCIQTDDPAKATLSFGATQVNGSGVTVPIQVKNDGSADMHIPGGGALFLQGGGDFHVDSVQLGTTVVTDFDVNGVTLPPGRSTECGAPTGTNANVATFNVKYVPTNLGADVDTFLVETDAVAVDGDDANGGEVRIPIDGVGSDVGILMDPSSINFGALGEGQTQTVDVLVSNVGTNTASVNQSCIDIDNDNVCDAKCTGQAADNTLSGTLTCKVTKTDGALESLGFVLAATDAVSGGDDERHIAVTWAPVAGATNIPAAAALILQSNILGGCNAVGDRGCFRAPLIGGTIGVVDVSTPDGDCGGAANGVCVHAAGSAADTTTWTGTATIVLTNSGAATVHVASAALSCPGGATIADDYSLGAITQATIAPSDHGDITVTYANNDFSTVDPCNVIINHDGAGAVTTVPIDVIPPP